MNHKKYGILFKCLVILVALCCIVAGAYIVPRMGMLILNNIYPHLAGWWIPWLIFAEIADFGVLIALIPSWKICSRISKGRAFSIATANELRLISRIILVDSFFFIIGNIVLRILGMNYATFMLLMFVVFFAGITIALFAGGLARLVKKGADIQDENDLTV